MKEEAGEKGQELGVAGRARWQEIQGGEGSVVMGTHGTGASSRVFSQGWEREWIRDLFILLNI